MDIKNKVVEIICRTHRTPKEQAEEIDELYKQALKKQLTLTEVSYPLCACGGNERVALDCTRKRCEHPKYAKSST